VCMCVAVLAFFVVKQSVDHTALVAVFPSFSLFLERYTNRFCLISFAENILKKRELYPIVLRNVLDRKEK
jgi:hypothetical protein